MADKRELLLIIKGRDQGAKKVLDDVGDAAESTEDDLSQMNAGLKKLDEQMAVSKDTAAKLRAEIAKTGDLGLIKDLQKAEADLKRFAKQRALLLAGGGEPGKDLFSGTVGDKLLKSLGRFPKIFGDVGKESGEEFSVGLIGKAGPLLARAPLSPPLVAAAVAAAPLVASALAGAVTAGIGAGAVAAGVRIAAADPSVQAAGKLVGQEVSIGLGQAAQDFVPETRKALGFLRREFNSLRPLLQDIFSDAAKYVEPLTRGVAGFGKGIAPGIRDAVRNAEPLIDMLEVQIPKAGRIAGMVISDLASTAETSADTIAGLLAATEGMLVVASKSLALLSEASPLLGLGPLQMLGDVMSDGDDDTMGWVDSLAQFAEAVNVAGDAAETSAQMNQRLLDSITALEDATYRSRDAVVNFEAGLDELSESVKENGTSLDIGSEKGRANVAVLNDLLDAATAAGDAERDQALARGESAEKAAAAGARLRETWINDLVASAEKAGFSKRQIEQMVAAARKADGERIRIYYDQVFRVLGKPFSDYTGIGGSTARGYSRGGMIDGPGPRGVDSVPLIGAPGEGVLNLRGMAAIGGEKALDALNNGGRVRQWMTGATGNYYQGGGGTTKVLVSVIPGMSDELTRAIMKAIRVEVAGPGSGSVQRTFGR